MRNNKGFATTFILFGLLILFLIVFSTLLFTMTNSSVLESKVKNKAIEKIEKEVAITANDIYYDNTTTGMTCETVQCALNNTSRVVNANINASKLCLRAKTLHEDTHFQYGRLGTKGTLTIGDAFDCDVNGDGVYDSETERFYYISRYNNVNLTNINELTNDNYAALIYYNNVAAGTPSNTSTFAYDSSGNNWYGPRDAITQLPTTDLWINTGLYNNKRNILSMSAQFNQLDKYTSGGNLPEGFSYVGYSARLLTAFEIKTSNCIEGSSRSISPVCSFLLENTYAVSTSYTKGYWLESPALSNADSAWALNGVEQDVRGGAVINPEYGIRPVIDVKLNDIEID